MATRLSSVSRAALAVGLFTAPALAQSVPFTSDLTGANEVPPVATAATGTGTFCYDSVSKLLEYTVTTTGMSGTSGHIHAGAPGSPGPIVFPLAGGPVLWSGVVGPFAPAEESLLVSGDLYVNIHSAAHPGGEIRDQLHFAGIAAAQSMRNAGAAPLNPAALLPDSTPGPVNGTVWTPVVDGTPSVWSPPLGPGSAFLLLVHTGPSVPDIFLGAPSGWILCSFAGPNPLAILGPVADSGGPVPFPVPIPSDCSLVSLSLCSQVVAFDGGTGFLRWTNALDFTIGSMP